MATCRTVTRRPIFEFADAPDSQIPLLSQPIPIRCVGLPFYLRWPNSAVGGLRILMSTPTIQPSDAATTHCKCIENRHERLDCLPH
jgi:hypothetical protein